MFSLGAFIGASIVECPVPVRKINAVRQRGEEPGGLPPSLFTTRDSACRPAHIPDVGHDGSRAARGIVISTALFG